MCDVEACLLYIDPDQVVVQGHQDRLAALATGAPSYLKLLEQFTTDKLFAISLTSVGQAIALANISNFIGKLDYTIWLK